MEHGLKIPLCLRQKLTVEEAIIQNQRNSHLNSQHNVSQSSTPILDTYKCAFILGVLKPAGIEKLRRKAPQEIGALLAQKKHMGKLLTLKEELEVWEWEARIAAKYKRKTNP